MPKLQATQTSMLGYEKRNPGTTTYHKTVAVEVNGEINQALFREALLLVMKRHPVLRSRLAEENTITTLESIADDKLPLGDTWPLMQIDATTHPDAPIEKVSSTLRKLRKKEFIDQPFQLGEKPMWRAAMMKLENNKHQIILSFHHLIVDEASIGIIMNDISNAYNALLHGKQPEFIDIEKYQTIDPALPPAAQQERLAYWKSNLNDLNTVKLEADKPATGAFQFNGKQIHFNLDHALIEKLKAAFPSVALKNILFATLYTLLYRYTGETDISIGTIDSNRQQDHAVPRDTMAQMVNAYFNSFPVRINTDDNEPTFQSIVAIVKAATENALQNQLPHDEILHHAIASEKRAHLSTAALFNFLLVTNSVKPTLSLEGTTATVPVEVDHGHSKFENFGINCDELPDGSLACFLEYNRDRFSEERIKQLIGHFCNILAHAAAHPDAKLAEIPMLSSHERHAVEKFNHTKAEASYTGTLADFMHKTAASAPKEQPIAVYHKPDGSKESITHAEMEDASNQLGKYIRHVSKDDKPIAICMSRSLDLIKATFAAIKAGKPFVMIDPSDPDSVDHILGSVKTAVVIVDEHSSHLFDGKPIEQINLDDASTQRKIEHYTKSYHQRKVDKDSVAYIMHTSGSTSKPKMVKCTHRALLNLLNSLKFDQDHKQHTKILSTAPLTFDGFLYDLVLALATTGEVHVTHDKARLSPIAIKHVVTNENIHFAALTAQMLAQLDVNSPLERVISMGSMAQENTLLRWTEAGKHVENDIGHTETGIQLSVHRFRVGDNCALIGKPIRNMKMLILDAHGNICPPNVRGELYVAGPGLAIDYHNNEELTGKKFRFANLNANKQKYIFTDKPNSDSIRLYETGDYCAYVDNGNHRLVVKFICRRDDLVKIHGLRIEPYEVRQVLARHPLVKDVIIKCVGDNDPTLIAYVVRNGDTPLDQLRKQLSSYLATTSLPVAAHPRQFILINKIPLNSRGKVMLDLLPLPVLPTRTPVQKQQSDIQALLINIWAQTLGKEPNEIDSTATFRELGGDSLSLASLETKLNQSQALRTYLRMGSNTEIGIDSLSVDMTISALESSLKSLAIPNPVSMLFPSAPLQLVNGGNNKQPPNESNAKVANTF